MLRVGIAGCGRVARIHLGRLLAREGVRLVGCADVELEAARAMAEAVPAGQVEGPVPAFADHKELLAATSPDALAIFTPHRHHYRLAMDALQAGCHVFIEKPVSTIPQEAVDIVKLARARGLKVAVGHQYRLRPSLIEARQRIAEGGIGSLRLVTATMAAPWLARHGEPADAWRIDPKLSGGAGGMLADIGDHVLDALLWTTGQSPVEVAAFQARAEAGPDLVTAAAFRLSDGSLVTLALSAVSAGSLFELEFYGERGHLRATESLLTIDSESGTSETLALPEPAETIDGNFVAAVERGEPLCCPAEEALDTVRLLEAIARSGATGQVVRLA